MLPKKTYTCGVVQYKESHITMGLITVKSGYISITVRVG
jgi:hypothetical protein